MKRRRFVRLPWKEMALKVDGDYRALVHALNTLEAEMRAEYQSNTMPILSDSATVYWADRLAEVLKKSGAR